jgi:hypothetical protein
VVAEIATERTHAPRFVTDEQALAERLACTPLLGIVPDALDRLAEAKGPRSSAARRLRKKGGNPTSFARAVRRRDGKSLNPWAGHLGRKHGIENGQAYPTPKLPTVEAVARGLRTQNGKSVGENGRRNEPDLLKKPQLPLGLLHAVRLGHPTS